MVLELAASAIAASVSMQVDSVTYDGHIAQAVMKVTNSAPSALDVVTLKCAFLDKDGKAIDVGQTHIMPMQGNSVAYEKIRIIMPVSPANAECYIDRVR
jgi:hypothetical protein